MSGFPDVVAREACALLNLGPLLGAPTRVEGGLLHRMWRFETTSGVYAVKDLDPEIMSRPGIAHIYRESERIARAIADAGISALPALQLMADPLLVLRDRSVLVFPWFEGHALGEDQVMASDARRIGELLGRIHALDLDRRDLPAPDAEAPDADSWRELVERGAAAGSRWAVQGGARPEELAAWGALYTESALALTGDVVVSHRDLDPKNVLWDDHGEPCLIDWESAGLVWPSLELAEVALNWSGQRIGEPKRDVFAGVLAGYRKSGPSHAVPTRAAFGACLGGWLGWLHYNARRSLGDTEGGPDERALGESEATATLDTLRRLAAGIGTWTDWAKEKNP